MQNQVQQIQVYYEIAMSIGKSLNADKMLKTALLVYLRKLNCVAGIVYQTHNSDEGEIEPQNFFSIPYTLQIENKYKDLECIISNVCKSSNDLEQQKLPISGQTSDGKNYHILSLKNFGILVLIKNEQALQKDILLNLRDINEKLSQAILACINNDKLIESERKYRDLIEFLPIMISEVDTQGKFTYANKFALQKMNYSEEEFKRGISVFDLFHPEDHNKLKKNIAQSLRSNQKTEHEYRVITNNGELLFVTVYANRLTKSDQSVSGLRGVMIDITDSKEYEIKLQQNLVQQELLSDIALDLNSLDQFSSRIKTALRKIGEHTGVSRVYIFEDSEDEQSTSNTFEWCLFIFY